MNGRSWFLRPPSREVGGSSEVCDESAIRRIAFAAVHETQDRRGMDGGENPRLAAGSEKLSAVPCQAKFGAEQRLRRGGAEADEHPRSDDLDLGFEPRVASLPLASIRLLVNASLASRHPFEVLHGVGDVG